jgi:hypothetical protein
MTLRHAVVVGLLAVNAAAFSRWVTATVAALAATESGDAPN